MPRNRIAAVMNPSEPQQPAPDWSPSTFIVCPLPWAAAVAPAQWAVQQWLYQRAFEEAQAVVRPSILERDLLGVWN